MSRKHNTKHRRSLSNYPARLLARGESPSTVRMPFIDRSRRKYSTLDSFLKRNREADEDA